MTDEQIAQFVSSTINTNDPKLLMATKELIPNYDEVLKTLTTDPLPETIAPSVKPKKSIFIPPTPRKIHGFTAASSAIPGDYKTGEIVQVKLPDGNVVNGYEVTGAGENGQLLIARAGAPRHPLTHKPEGERTIDPKYLAKPTIKEGDLVKLDIIPANSTNAVVTQYVQIVKMGPVKQFAIPDEPQTKVDVDKDSILVKTSVGEYTLVPKSSLLGKVNNAP